MIEDCEIQPEANSSEATYGLVLTFSAGQLQHLATYTENERDSWIAALRSASHRQMRSHLEDLRSRLKAKTMNSTEPSNSSVIGNNKNLIRIEHSIYFISNFLTHQNKYFFLKNKIHK